MAEEIGMRIVLDHVEIILDKVVHTKEESRHCLEECLALAQAGLLPQMRHAPGVVIHIREPVHLIFEAVRVKWLTDASDDIQSREGFRRHRCPRVRRQSDRRENSMWQLMVLEKEVVAIRVRQKPAANKADFVRDQWVVGR